MGTFFVKIAVFFIKLYRYLLSPLLGVGKCRFEPTCSEYAIEAFKKKGFFKGFFLTVFRILRCNPFCKGGQDKLK